MCSQREAEYCETAYRFENTPELTLSSPRFPCRFPALFDPVKFMHEHDASGFREMYLQVIGVSKFQR